jgi:hypothetical protein
MDAPFGIAFMSLLFRMLSPHMYRQVVGRCAYNVTTFKSTNTFELFPGVGMRAHVSRQVAKLREGFTAYLADILSPTRMNKHMPIQTDWIYETHRTSLIATHVRLPEFS